MAAGVRDATRPQGEGGIPSPRIPCHPLLPPAGVSGAGDPVPQPPAALQPVPPEVHAGGRAGARGGERPEVSFAARALWGSARPTAASQLNAAGPALPIALALARLACRSTRRQRGHWSHLMGRHPHGEAQMQALTVDLGHLLAVLLLRLASHTDYLACDCCSRWRDVIMRTPSALSLSHF